MIKTNLKKIFFLITIILAHLSIFTTIYCAEFKGKFIQGHFILGKTDPGSNVWVDDQKVRVTKDGFFVFGLGRDRKYDVTITLQKKDKKEKIIKKVIKRKYKIQKIDGLPEKKVTPPKELYERIKKENKIIARARSVNSNLEFFKKKFINPLDKAIVTGVYGSQRVLNGKPRWPHYGVDFAAKEGTEIKAMLDGTATMVESDLFYTGGTLIFDHGHGISTLYMHMKNIYVEKGQKVKQGDIIGTVGSTGRSTGAHLDIRLNWFGIRLDPATVLNIN
jgi:Membrane proteins related to metalloendopeptidases